MEQAPELLSAIVEFRPTEAVALHRESDAQLLHAAFLDHLRRFTPALADELHRESRRKPFTLSHINCGPNGLRQLLPEQTYRFRITALTPQLCEALVCFSPEEAGELLLLGQPMELLGLKIAGVPWAAMAAPLQLVQRWFYSERPPLRRIGLRFCSPTLCQSADPARGRFPEPELVFKGLAEKWFTFTNVDPAEWPASINRIIEEAAIYAGELLRVSRYKLSTAVEHFRGRDGSAPFQKIGYIGTVEYVPERPASAAALRALGLLADYAFFAGVGYKTTMGMGQVQPLRFRS